MCLPCKLLIDTPPFQKNLNLCPDSKPGFDSFFLDRVVVHNMVAYGLFLGFYPCKRVYDPCERTCIYVPSSLDKDGWQQQCVRTCGWFRTKTVHTFR